MREIKFRGKCVPDSKYAGQWVTGGYVAPDADCKKRDEGLIVKYLGGNTTITYHVDPDTVGQYTGLKDRNGVEIYEGDIVLVSDWTSVYASDYKGTVCFKRGQWVVSYEKYGCEKTPKLFFDDFSDRKTTIIGNIYDNQELLEKE